MSTLTGIRVDTFLAEGNVRLVVVLAAVVCVAAYFALPYLPEPARFNAWMLQKTPTIHGTVLAMMAAFVAALLTIWTLMKTRSTRYIERLADSEHFSRFIANFEARIVFGALALLLTAVLAIGGWSLTAAHTPETVFTLVWVFMCLSATALLIDSLLTARVLL